MGRPVRFYPGSAESGARKVLEQIEATDEERLQPFRQSIRDVRNLLERHGFSEKPGDDRKLELLRLCRAELPKVSFNGLTRATR